MEIEFVNINLQYFLFVCFMKYLRLDNYCVNLLIDRLLLDRGNRNGQTSGNYVVDIVC